jgi:phosphatidate cytidylyltransferase
MLGKSKKQVFISRLTSTLVLWSIVAGVYISDSPWAFVGMIFLMGALAINEYFGMASKAQFPADRYFGSIASLLFLALVCVILAIKGNLAFDFLHDLDSAFIAAMVIFHFSYQLKAGVENDVPLRKVAATILGFLYVAFLFSFMARLFFWDPTNTVESKVPGAWLVLWLCVVTKFTDMGAYLTGTICGSYLKTHKMIPHISPGKTWEGFAGAMVIALGSACGMYALTSAWDHVVALGIILPLFAVVGDLAESVIKRSLNIKDSGKILPGIGGALDLIDSLCFTAPVVYLYLKWISYF